MTRIKAGSININYETVGKGEPLLLIMGFIEPGAAWLPSLPLLSMFQCIYFDNRGTGLSDKPEGIYTIEQMADDASNLLKALNLPKAKVFGVSMGGMIAQELVLRHPDQVEKVVLGCTWPGGPNSKMPSPEIGQKLMEAAKMMAVDTGKAIDILMPLLYTEEFVRTHPETKMLMMEQRSSMLPTPPQTADRTMAGLMAFNTYDRLPQITCPVLIAHGDQDVLIPVENARIIKDRIPRAELYIISGAGHLFWAPDSEGIHRRIVEFLG